MADMEVVINLLGLEKSAVKSDKNEHLTKRQLKDLFEESVKILVHLKDKNLERSDLNAIRAFIFLLSGDYDGRLRDALASIDDDILKTLISKMLSPSEDEDTKRKLSITIQAKLLMKVLLKELSPHVAKSHSMLILDHIQVNLGNRYNTLVLLNTLFHHCTDKDQFASACHFVIKLAKNQTVSSKIHRVCIGLMCSLENPSLLAEVTETNLECFEAATRKLCNWLIFTSSNQALPSAQQNEKASPIRKKIAIQEIDGTPSRDFFTVLNLTSVLNTDQMHNIYAFSMLQNWLLVLQNHDVEIWNNVLKNIPRTSRPSSAAPRLVGQSSFYIASSASSDSSGPVSLSSSLSSLNSFLYVENEGDKSKDSLDLIQHSPKFATPPSLYENRSLHSLSSNKRPMSVSTPKRSESMNRDVSFASRKMSSASIVSISTGGVTLKNASIRYCLRLLGQAEKIPRKSEDRTILTAAVIEAVRILTLLCQQDDTLVKKVFPEIERVHGRIIGESTYARRLYPADIQYFVEHYDSMIYNAEELVQSYLKTVPSQLYTSSSACFEIFDFCLRNFAFFERFPFLSRFFPNLFKMVAWNPRSFLYEILELLPILVTDSTLCELFHSILDIPCISAMLELTELNTLDKYLGENLEANFGESGTFLSKSSHAISEFFLRCESGGPETIDKLDKVYVAIRPLSKRTRVQVCCQIVPMLLRKFFQCVSVQVNENMIKELFPSMLERIFILFPDPAFQTAVRTLLSEQFTNLCINSPRLISSHQDEVLYFFKQIRCSLPGLDSVASSLVYCIGEFSVRPGVCSMEQIAKYYEIIETLIYEAKSSLFCNDDLPVCSRLVSSLISTAGKLAAFSQDFVPKTVLCLTKLANTEWGMGCCRINQREFEVVMSRAVDVINVLRLPNVSPAILCCGANTEPWHLDADSSQKLKVHAMARRKAKHK